MICEEFPTLEGRQEPHEESIFPGDLTHAGKAIELARRAGAISMPWQKRAQNAILSTTSAGRWTHSDCCLIIPRQNGKSEILILRCLYGLFKLGETILYTAQRWKTARDGWKRLMSIIKSRSWLSKRVTRATCSQGEGVIEINGGAGEPNGASISFGTRSNDTGRGLTKVDLIIYDEAYNLTDGEISAMSFTQMAAENPQTIYASSAVNKDEHPNGAVLAAVRIRGLSREPDLYFAEYMAPEGMPHDSEETWKYANPSYGVVQTADKIRKIMRGLSTPAGRKGFGVEALGRGDWPVADAAPQWSVIDEDDWNSLKVYEKPEFVGPKAIGVDRTMDRALWCIAAAQRTTEGRIHVEVGYFRPSTQAGMVSNLANLVGIWDPCATGTDGKSPSTVLEPLLAAPGTDIELSKSNTGQIAVSCAGILDDIESGVLSISDQPALNASAEGAVKRELPGGDFVWSKRGEAQIAPLNAITHARWALLTFESRWSGPPVAPAWDREAQPDNRFGGGSWHTNPNDFDALAVGF